MPAPKPRKTRKVKTVRRRGISLVPSQAEKERMLANLRRIRRALSKAKKAAKSEAMDRKAAKAA